LDGTGGWESEITAAERADGARLEGVESPMDAAAGTARVPLYETAPSKRRERVASRADGSEEGAVAAAAFDRETPVSTSADAACSFGACAGVKAGPAAMTATDFAAAGKETGLKERGVSGMAGV
jgi:hypothetical protein